MTDLTRESTISESNNIEYPIQSMSQVLLPWLDSNDWHPNQLIRWLQGYDLPALGSDDEPYIWLLYGLPVGEERYQRETQLAKRVAYLLYTRPDIDRPGKVPEQLLYNLLMLCAGLSSPDQLAEPLYDMYKRRGLDGQWLGIQLCEAFQAALIMNQLDGQFASVWKRMVEDQKHEFLPGNEYDGFEGIVWMPASTSTRGEPALRDIGYALKIMAHHLGEEPDRRPEFSALLDKVQDVYPGHSTWEIDLLNLAHEYQWPTWAVECLPSLSIVLGDVEPQRCQFDNIEVQHCKRLAVWWPFTKVLEAGCHVANFQYETERALCDNQVFQVVIPQNVMLFIEGVASFVEPNRIDNPFSSMSSVVGNIADAMSAYELELLNEDPLGARILKEAHKDILQQQDLIYSFSGD